MPLDAHRFGWTPPFPTWLKALGGVCLLASAFLLFRAFRDNTFLLPLVRLQAERKHTVVTTGVYAVVRHPMYLGAGLMFVGEERLLQRELEGYAAYQKAVRYRLVPLVW